jgi:hypothetical protein
LQKRCGCINDIRVLRHHDDRGANMETFVKRPLDAFDGLGPTPAETGNRIVDRRIIAIDRERKIHAEQRECLPDSRRERGSVGENLDEFESKNVAVLDQPNEVGMDRRFSPDELNAPTAHLEGLV